jgi:hypothetical protein
MNTAQITTHNTARSFTAFAFAALFTVATLGAVDGLAHKPVAGAQMAAHMATNSAPLQTIVVVGKRLVQA